MYDHNKCGAKRSYRFLPYQCRRLGLWWGRTNPLVGAWILIGVLLSIGCVALILNAFAPSSVAMGESAVETVRSMMYWLIISITVITCGYIITRFVR